MTSTEAITRSTTSTRPVWTAAAASGAVAAVSTACVAALADAAGISLRVDGEPIPVSGFATLTVAAVVVGYVLATALNRFASRPRRAFTMSTVALTVASFVPDLTFPMSADTRVVLIATHLIAAVIVIPAIAGRLAQKR